MSETSMVKWEGSLESWREHLKECPGGPDCLVVAPDYPAVLDESRERAERIRADHRIADLARAYCAAMHANKSAEPCDWEARAIDVDRAYYDLMVACGYFEVDE